MERRAFKIVGPFGGQRGNPWDDGICNSTIRQIIINSGSKINSIQIEYDQNGQSKWSEKHGGADCDSGKEDKIILDYPSEFLSSISGYHTTTGDSNTAVVQSLTIQSNRKVYGPYGIEEGKHFSPLSINGKIIGLFGMSDICVNSVGFYIEPLPSISIGPFGGHGGHEWDDGPYTTIRQMIISYGDVIDSIQIEYDHKGQSIWSDKHGERVGGKGATVKLDYPSEFLNNISGYCTEGSSGTVLRSLTIHSNRKTFGPYGSKIGKYFSTTSTGGKIIGLHGRCDLFLDSIGAYFEAKDFLSIGPFGGFGGHQWDDGTNTTIREIYIHYADVIDSIQIEYDKDGYSKMSDLHGEGGGYMREKIKLDYSNEYVISISGYCTEDSSNSVVRSLIIQSNKNQYGPYGREEGKYFSTSSTGGKIVGFYGRCGLYLDSIGAYFEAI